jgi:hypothetical protein
MKVDWRPLFDGEMQRAAPWLQVVATNSSVNPDTVQTIEVEFSTGLTVPISQGLQGPLGRGAAAVADGPFTTFVQIARATKSGELAAVKVTTALGKKPHRAVVSTEVIEQFRNVVLNESFFVPAPAGSPPRPTSPLDPDRHHP